MAATLTLGMPGAWAQSLFSPAITVNENAITYYELEQRLAFLQLLGAPGEEVGGLLEFSGSPDGVAWGPSLRLDSGLDLSAVRVGFGMESSGPMTSEIGISVDGYNAD